MKNQLTAILGAGYCLMVIFGFIELYQLSEAGYSLPALSLAYGTATVFIALFIIKIMSTGLDDSKPNDPTEI